MKDIKSFPMTEQETSITFMRNDKKIEICTSDTTMITRLSKVTDDIEVLTVGYNGRITSAKFTISFAQLSFRKPKKPTTEAQRKAIEKATKSSLEARKNKK